MKVLDKKLLRDIRRLWAQSLAVAFVMAAGVATLLLGLGTYNSLFETRRAYYERSQFADIFANAIRSPKTVVGRIAQIDGVAEVESRIMKSAIIDIDEFPLPITGVFVSLPANGENNLNRLFIRSGRLPEPGSLNQVAITESFAGAHDLSVGFAFSAILNGTRRRLTVTAIVLSPEYIYAIGPGDMMPDDRRFGVFWMREPALAHAFNMNGAFNSISVTTLSGAKLPEITTEIDHQLSRFGGEKAYLRDTQISHAFLNAELKQLWTISRMLPPAFLIVTAFLINMVISRIISLEREQIGLLKAIGYSSASIALHYVKLVLLIAFGGIAIGFVVGTLLSHGLTSLYARFFHFPYQIHVYSGPLYAIAALVAATSALAGAFKSTLEISEISPSLAMRPPMPPIYRSVLPINFGLTRYVSQLTIMTLRHVIRWPLRSTLTTLGIALSVGLLVASLFTSDAINFMVDAVFERTERQDASIYFGKAMPVGVVGEVRRLPGVLAVEPFLTVEAEISRFQIKKRLSILGRPANADISRLLNSSFEKVEVPKSGLLLGDAVAKALHVHPGDLVHVEFLGRQHRNVDIPVVAIVQSYIGLLAVMDQNALARTLNEGPAVSGVHLLIDPRGNADLMKLVKQQPKLSTISLQRISLAKFRETIAQNINIQIAVYVSLATIIAFGVVYNSARIQFAERARELASLRVLGFSDGEVSRILLLEYALLTVFAVPIGWAAGYGLAYLLVTGFQSDLYRLPFIIGRATFAYSALIVIMAVALSALIVRRRVSKLDLIRVLKTRD